MHEQLEFKREVLNQWNTHLKVWRSDALRQDYDIKALGGDRWPIITYQAIQYGAEGYAQFMRPSRINFARVITRDGEDRIVCQHIRKKEALELMREVHQ
jgi:hypothetical protein